MKLFVSGAFNRVHCRRLYSLLQPTAGTVVHRFSEAVVGGALNFISNDEVVGVDPIDINKISYHFPPFMVEVVDIILNVAR